jgi:hypothetical protein
VGVEAAEFGEGFAAVGEFAGYFFDGACVLGEGDFSGVFLETDRERERDLEA